MEKNPVVCRNSFVFSFWRSKAFWNDPTTTFQETTVSLSNSLQLTVLFSHFRKFGDTLQNLYLVCRCAFLSVKKVWVLIILCLCEESLPQFAIQTRAFIVGDLGTTTYVFSASLSVIIILKNIITFLADKSMIPC